MNTNESRKRKINVSKRKTLLVTGGKFILFMKLKDDDSRGLAMNTPRSKAKITSFFTK